MLGSKEHWDSPLDRFGRVVHRHLVIGLGALNVTSVYLRRLEGQEDHGWGAVAEAIGVV